MELSLPFLEATSPTHLLSNKPVAGCNKPNTKIWLRSDLLLQLMHGMRLHDSRGT